jgi:hypothetical protein
MSVLVHHKYLCNYKYLTSINLYRFFVVDDISPVSYDADLFLKNSIRLLFRVFGSCFSSLSGNKLLVELMK